MSMKMSRRKTMERTIKKKYDFTITNLGEPKIPSPIMMSTEADDGLADYVPDSKRIYFGIDARLNEQGEVVSRRSRYC